MFVKHRALAVCASKEISLKSTPSFHNRYAQVLLKFDVCGKADLSDLNDLSYLRFLAAKCIVRVHSVTRVCTVRLLVVQSEVTRTAGMLAGPTVLHH